MVNGMPQSPSKQRPWGVHFLLGDPLVTFGLDGVHTQSIIIMQLGSSLFFFKIRFVLTMQKDGSEKAWEDVILSSSRFLKAPILLRETLRICKVSSQCLGADKPPKGGVGWGFGRGRKGWLSLWSCEWVSLGTHFQFWMWRVNMLLPIEAMYAASFCSPVRQTSPAGSSWLQSACDDGSGSLVPYWVDCRSGQVLFRGIFAGGLSPIFFPQPIHSDETWSLFDGDIPAETWGIKDFFYAYSMFTHLNFEGCIDASLVNHSLDVNLDSLRIHSLHISPLSCQIFCTHFRRYWPTKQLIQLE